jgi:hypothetical protein
MSAAAAGAAAAAAAATAQAIRASGVVVQLESEPLVVHATGGFLSTTYQYLTSYKGLAFFTKSSEPLALGKDVEMVVAGSIWIPG